jgi:hypothetical protein
MMFDPGSEDGRNISTLNGRIYQSETYSQNLQAHPGGKNPQNEAIVLVP